MTQIQRERILELQDAGLGYKKIAAELGISVNTVKSFCRRQRLKDVRRFLPAMRQPDPTATKGAEKEILFGQMPVQVVEPASGAAPASNDAASDLCMVRQSV